MIRRHGTCFARLCLIGLISLAAGCAGGRASALVPGIKVEDVSEGPYRVEIWALGTDLKSPGPRVLRGRGLIVHFTDMHNGKVLFDAGSGEIDWDVVVDYRDLGSGVIRYTECTYDPRSQGDGIVPFIGTTVKAKGDGTCTQKEALLLDGEPFVASEIAELKKVLMSPAAEEDETCNFAAGHLRNMAITDPEGILRVFEELNGRVRGVGTCETLGRYEDEVRRILAIRSRDASVPKQKRPTGVPAERSTP